MGHYNHRAIEKKWQDVWEKAGIFAVSEDPALADKSCYILDMFPYPSGAGLHVGHPEGYTATDIVSRKRRMEGWNVLHPMGFDAFGLPAENYAIKTGVHPAESTKANIANFTRQMQGLGFSYDWSRALSTADPEYYRWTQWLFLQLYKKGLAYKRKAPVNWCEKDQTVLANEQVVDGKCERCGSEVVQKDLEQWFFKVTAYADRLLDDVVALDWPDKIKAMQRHWIGRSEGAEIVFHGDDFSLVVYTTRPDTLYGVSYVALAPEHPLVSGITVSAQKTAVEAYVAAAQKKNDIERQRTDREKDGVFTGAYVRHPITGEQIPVWVADYVLHSYGTGAVMGVPAHDVRDGVFAQTYQLPVREVIEPVTGVPQIDPEFRRSIVAIVRNPKDGTVLSLNWGDLGGHLFIGGGREENEDIVACALREIAEETGYTHLQLVAQTGRIHHSYFAKSKNVARKIEAYGLLFDLVDDARQDVALVHDEVGKFVPEWLSFAVAEKQVQDALHATVFRLLVKGERFTGNGIMVNSGGFDGMSNEEAKWKIVEKAGGTRSIKYRLRDWLVSRQRYWGAPIPIISCDHCGMLPVPEEQLPVLLPTDVDFRPTGESPLARSVSFHDVQCPQCGGAARRESDTMDTFVDSSWYFLRYCSPHFDGGPFSPEAVRYWCPVDVYVGGAEHAVLHLLFARFFTKALHDAGMLPFDEPFVKLRNQGLILGEDGEKMSKSRGNVINPDDVVVEHGADTLRLYEMFMGDFEDAKPWDTKGIVGVRRFLDRMDALVRDIAAAPRPSLHGAALALLHKTIAKVSADIEAFKFNTAISTLMILLNEWPSLEGSRDDAGAFVKLLSPFAPHLAEELWQTLGMEGFVSLAAWPIADPVLLVDATVEVVVQVNGKLRDRVFVPSGSSDDVLREAALASLQVQKHLEGKTVQQVVIARGKLVNIVAV